MFARALQPVGAYRSLAVGGQWNPACANEKGCELEQCKNSLSCRKEAPNKLELFVMSQCPYGTQALNSMKEVLDAFENKIDFQVHYIGNGTKDALTSMHGPGEVDEDIRELCAMKHYPKNYKWMDYVLCRNKDIRSPDWQKCATKETGVDAKVIEKCVASDGKELLEASFKVAAGLGIGASPSWVANGKNQFSAAGAESIKQSFCGFNKGIKGCEKTLSSATPGAPAGGGCGK